MLHKRAQCAMPDGVPSGYQSQFPHPIYWERGSGSKLQRNSAPWRPSSKQRANTTTALDEMIGNSFAVDVDFVAVNEDIKTEAVVSKWLKK